ncbi:MAG TPA: hypothetical protein VMU17_02460, partial [Elusimicrobiota bacterium]|nr:hypothetical protein [Elusimicrobiota bacterium]
MTIRKLLSLTVSFSLIGTSVNVPQAAAAVPQIFAAPSDLPQFRLVPPGNLGRIVDYFNSDEGTGRRGDGVKPPTALSRPVAQSPSHPLVILIQDLHAHYGVQKNIAGLLDFLDRKLSPSNSKLETRNSNIPFAVAVEGAEGPIDSSILANFPDAQVKEQASQFLMREGELSGAEYFAVKRGLPNLLVGVENEQYYDLHRELFRKTYADRARLVEALHGVQADIATLPRRIYSGQLRSFQKDMDAFDQGLIDVPELIGLLINRVRPGSDPGARKGSDPRLAVDLAKDFPTIASFAADAGVKNGVPDYGPTLRRFLHPAIGLSPETLRAATAQFLGQAQSALTPEEKANLTVLAKQSDSSAYYLYMRDLVYDRQLFLAVPPELAHYLEYMHTTQTAGLDQILEETQELAFRIKLSLAETQQQKDLVQVQHDLDLVLRVADLQATELEVRLFAPRLNQFVVLLKSLLSAKGLQGFDQDGIKELISSSVDYYVMAMLRNEPMVENTLALLGQGTAGNQNSGITITAGSPERQRKEIRNKHKHLSPPLRPSRPSGTPAVQG